MNKYIILIIIFLLIVIVLYFNYKNNKLEYLTEATINTDTLLTILENNNLFITDEGTLQLNIDDEQYNLNIDDNKVNIGDKFSFDPSNNKLQCGKYNLDKDGSLRDNTNFKVDPSGNITMWDFLNSNSFSFDKNKNIITSEYTLKPINKQIKKNDNSLLVNFDNVGNSTCGIYQQNNNIDKIVLGTDTYLVNNNKITDSINSFSIEPNIIKMNFNKYTYDINKNDLSGNINSLGTFNMPSTGNLIYLNNAIYNYNDIGSLIYGISQIILKKPINAIPYNNPLFISSIRFFDYNNNVITPNNYTVTLNNIANGAYNLDTSVSLFEQYYNMNYNTNISYGGPKVDAYSLFWNKTISFKNGIPQIDTISQNYLDISHDFIGHGISNIPYLDNSQSNYADMEQSYTFRFNKPYFIKYVEIESRKDNYLNINKLLNINSGIMNSFIDTYTTIDNKLKRINSTSCLNEKVINNNITTILIKDTISVPSQTKIQPINKIEKYSLENYIIDNNQNVLFDPIVRYYIQ